MRLTTKGYLTVTALVDLAARGGNAPVTLQGIGERQKISLSYLEKLFGKLLMHNIVKSVRGPGGGYCLARPGSQITISDIILAVDEPLEATNGRSKRVCRDGHRCNIDTLWYGLNEVLHAYLSTVSVQQLVDMHLRDDAAATPVTLGKLARTATTGPKASLSPRQQVPGP